MEIKKKLSLPLFVPKKIVYKYISSYVVICDNSRISKNEEKNMGIRIAPATRVVFLYDDDDDDKANRIVATGKERSPPTNTSAQNEPAKN